MAESNSIQLTGLFGKERIRYVVSKLIAATQEPEYIDLNQLADNITDFIATLLDANQQFVIRHHIPQYDPNYRDEEEQPIL